MRIIHVSHIGNVINQNSFVTKLQHWRKQSHCRKESNHTV